MDWIRPQQASQPPPPTPLLSALVSIQTETSHPYNQAHIHEADAVRGMHGWTLHSCIYESGWMGASVVAGVGSVGLTGMDHGRVRPQEAVQHAFLGLKTCPCGRVSRPTQHSKAHRHHAVILCLPCGWLAWTFACTRLARVPLAHLDAWFSFSLSPPTTTHKQPQFLILSSPPHLR